MLQLAWPYLLLLAPLPLVVHWIAPVYREKRAALRVPFLERIAELAGASATRDAGQLRGTLLQRSLLIGIWLLLLVALCRPQWLDAPITRTIPTRDLLLAVDLSGSMEAEDFTNAAGARINRVAAVQEVLDSFLQRRKGDRVGLIFFGSAPFVQAPFTEDLEVCRTLLWEARPRMAGPRTVIGDAIGKAITIFDASDLPDRVLILLTDGNDTDSLIAPPKAAEIARDRGITIHTIGIGDPTTVGEEQLDTETLDTIAQTTGGRSFLALDRTELAGVYEEIDRLETRDAETQSHRPVHELYWLPLLLGVLLTLLYHLSIVLRNPALRQAALVPVTLGVVVFLLLWLVQVPTGSAPVLRPRLLWLLLPASWLIWLVRHQASDRRPWQGIVAPPLLDALLVKPAGRSRLRPVDLLGVVLLLSILAAAGPAWQRQESPFAQNRAAHVVVLEVTPSMLTSDVAPSRLVRATQKLQDLFALTKDARFSLIAYAGSAHLVMPLTHDAELIRTFAGELTPEIMPRAGDDPQAALELALQQLASSGQRGSILLLCDDLPEVGGDLRQRLEGAVTVLGMVGAQNQEARSKLGRAARGLGAGMTFATVDESDVQRVAGQLTRHVTRASSADQAVRWRDDGYWLVPLLCGLVLVWFRPGWVVAWE